LIMLKLGPRNLITDVDGLLVGNAQDTGLRSGVSVVMGERPFVASVDVRGGAPGTRDTELLDPSNRVDRIDAICLSGGSALTASGSLALALAAVALHTAAMLAATGLVAAGVQRGIARWSGRLGHGIGPVRRS